MPLVKIKLEQDIFLAFKRMSNSGKDIDEAQKELAKDLASAIDSYIRSATIIVPPGQVITGAGGGLAPVVGATSAPSPTAIIS
jgi:hypothetical protein